MIKKTTMIKYLHMSYALHIVVALLLAGCSAIPPMDNPDISFGRRCSDNGTWSYVWIYDESKGLNASKEKCND